MTVRPRVLLPLVESGLDSRSFAAAAQLAALHLSQDPFMFTNWDVTFDMSYVVLNDTKEDGLCFPLKRLRVRHYFARSTGLQRFELAQGFCVNGTLASMPSSVATASHR